MKPVAAPDNRGTSLETFRKGRRGSRGHIQSQREPESDQTTPTTGHRGNAPGPQRGDASRCYSALEGRGRDAERQGLQRRALEEDALQRAKLGDCKDLRR